MVPSAALPDTCSVVAKRNRRRSARFMSRGTGQILRIDKRPIEDIFRSAAQNERRRVVRGLTRDLTRLDPEERLGPMNMQYVAHYITKY